MSKAEFSIGDIVKVCPNNDNENYSHFRDIPLKIVHVATSIKDHPGYDDSLEGSGLYDFVNAKTLEPIGCSLYDYELTKY